MHVDVIIIRIVLKNYIKHNYIFIFWFNVMVLISFIAKFKICKCEGVCECCCFCNKKKKDCCCNTEDGNDCECCKACGGKIISNLKY
jgi:hypothetical protein